MTAWGHDFAIHLGRPAKDDDALTFDLRTFDVDADDDGRAQDFGSSIIEGATIVGDGTRRGYDEHRILQLLSLLEHAPELAQALSAFVSGRQDAEWLKTRGKALLTAINDGTLKYGRH